jgi:hypothetical protein
VKTNMGMGMEFQAFLTAVLDADNWSAVRLDIPTPNKVPRHPLHKRLGGSHSRSKYGDEESDTDRQTKLLKSSIQMTIDVCVACSLLLFPFKANLLPGSNVVPTHPNFCHTTYVTRVARSLRSLLNTLVIDTSFIATLR